MISDLFELPEDASSTKEISPFFSEREKKMVEGIENPAFVDFFNKNQEKIQVENLVKIEDSESEEEIEENNEGKIFFEKLKKTRKNNSKKFLKKTGFL